jgi:hypothetical protein
MILACPFCKAKVDPAVATCSSCGKLMTRACPACAETIAANSTSCKYCGEAVAPKKEAAPVKADPGIVFLEEPPRRRCCPGRTMFWLMVGLLAGFCAFSAIKTRIHVHRGVPVKQEIQKIEPQTDPAPERERRY